MSRNLSEDDIRIIDNRGRYSIRKGVVWGVVAVILLAGILFGTKIIRQARFISELTSGKVASEQQIDIAALDNIRVIEVNGAKVDLTIGEGNLRLLYWAIGLLPEKYSANPHKDLAIAYKAFKKRVGSQHLEEFDYDVVHVKVDYQSGKAYRYSFSNSLNDYSMTVICSYDELVKKLDEVVDIPPR